MKAAANDTLLAQLREREEGDEDDDYDAGYDDSSVWYCGTPEQLIAAGLVEPGAFPGDPGRNKTSQTDRYEDGRRRRIVKCGGGNYRVNLTASKAERQQIERVRIADRLAKQKDAAAAALGAAEAQIAKLPRNSAQYLRNVALLLKAISSGFIRPLLLGQDTPFSRMATGSLGGYKVDAASLEAFDDAMSEALEALQNARAFQDRGRRDAIVTKVRAGAAKADPAFQLLLSTVLARP
jgi:hypothetical protein